MNSFYSGPKRNRGIFAYVLCIVLLSVTLLPITAANQGALIALNSGAERALPLIAKRLAIFQPELKYTSLSASESRTALLESDTEALAWFAGRYEYDQLILVSLTGLDRFERLKIKSVEESEERLLLDMLIPFGVVSAAESEIDSALCTLSAELDRGALLISDVANLQKISVNKKEVRADRPLLLTAGEHSVCFDNNRCIEVVITAGEITTVVAPPLEFESAPLVVHSGVGVVKWYLDGVLASQEATLAVEHPNYPLSIGITKEHYAPHLLTLEVPPPGELSLDLQYALPAAERIIDRQQQDFYKGLRNTILLFGAYVASTALAQSSANASLWQIAQVSVGALTLVQAIATGAHLASYGQVSGLL